MNELLKLLGLAIGIVLILVTIFFIVLLTVEFLFGITFFSPANFIVAFVTTVGILSLLGILLAVLRKR